MQHAVDIVGTSLHATNKIAATLFGFNAKGESYSVSRTNFWPPILLDTFGMDARYGGSSGTIHAETACILAASHTEGASLCVTDPFCPNCAKNIAEAGIRTIYIDHKGFDKDFAARRSDHFKTMSMQICERAGISVYELWRREGKLVPILEVASSYEPANDSPLESELMDSAAPSFQDFVAAKREKHYNRRIAAAFARDVNGHIFGLAVRAHPAIGYSMSTDADEIEHPHGKYNFMLEPLNRLLMNAARRGLRLIDGAIYSSRVPTAREQINFVGAGLRQIYIGDWEKARDDDAFHARDLLAGKGIVTFNQLD